MGFTKPIFTGWSTQLYVSRKYPANKKPKMVIRPTTGHTLALGCLASAKYNNTAPTIHQNFAQAASRS
jgi:hypothetical protein